MILEYPEKAIRTSHKIVFHTDEGNITLHLRGIIYHGGYHFTSRVIDSEGNVWYYDGQKGQTCDEEGNLGSKSDQDLRECKGRNLVLAVYSQT